MNSLAKAIEKSYESKYYKGTVSYRNWKVDFSDDQYGVRFTIYHNDKNIAAYDDKDKKVQFYNGCTLKQQNDILEAIGEDVKIVNNYFLIED